VIPAQILVTLEPLNTHFWLFGIHADLLQGNTFPFRFASTAQAW
jgi:hypothetical protein